MMDSYPIPSIQAADQLEYLHSGQLAEFLKGPVLLFCGLLSKLNNIIHA